MDIKFKTCPFCGGEVVSPGAIYYSNGTNLFHFVNHKQDCILFGKVIDLLPHEFEAWNTRAERTCRMEHNERKRGVYCSHCGKRMDSFVCNNYGDGTMEYAYPFCCKCGAKMVE